MQPGNQPDNQNPLVYCVVLNWNGWEDTLKCLSSLVEQDYPNLRIVVVDNHSTNDSVARIRQAFPDIPLLQNPENGGFSKGNNLGIRVALKEEAEFVWLLNNDTIAPPNTATELVAKALSRPSAGAIGTVLYYMDSPDQMQAWGGGHLSVLHGYNKHFTSPTDFGSGTFLTGASVLLRAEALRQIGLLDEAFFMYCEDVDLCFRLRKAGWQIAVAESTAVLHKENASLAKRSPRMDHYSAASGVRLLRLYSPVPTVSVSLYLGLRLLNRLRRGEWVQIKAVIRGASGNVFVDSTVGR